MDNCTAKARGTERQENYPQALHALKYSGIPWYIYVMSSSVPIAPQSDVFVDDLAWLFHHRARGRHLATIGE